MRSNSLKNSAIVLAGIIGFASGLGLKLFEISELKKEIQDLKNKMPEMPITVVDKATGNQLYIGRPIPRENIYEFPITLNDGKGSYRIDSYELLNQFKGKLIIAIEQAPKPLVIKEEKTNQ